MAMLFQGDVRVSRLADPLGLLDSDTHMELQKLDVPDQERLLSFVRLLPPIGSHDEAPNGRAPSLITMPVWT